MYRSVRFSELPSVWEVHTGLPTAHTCVIVSILNSPYNCHLYRHSKRTVHHFITRALVERLKEFAPQCGGGPLIDAGKKIKRVPQKPDAGCELPRDRHARCSRLSAIPLPGRHLSRRI